MIRRVRQQRREILVSRILNIVIGVIAIAAAANVSRLGTILEIANKLINGFTGPLLGIFILGMFTRRATQRGVFIGGLVGTLCSAYGILWSSPELVTTSLRALLPLFPQAVAVGGPVLSFIWPSSMGLVATLVVGYLVSLFEPEASGVGGLRSGVAGGAVGGRIQIGAPGEHRAVAQRQRLIDVGGMFEKGEQDGKAAGAQDGVEIIRV